MSRQLLHQLLGELREANAIHAAINYGELLAAPPPDPNERRRHSVAVTLLERQAALLARGLIRCQQIADELEGASEI